MSFPYHTEPAHTQGTVAAAPRTSATVSTEGRQILDVADRIFLLEPNKTPLTTLLTNVGKVWDGKAWQGSSMQKAPAGDSTFSWIEDFYGGRYAKVNATYNAGDDPVTITVSGAGSSSAHIFTKGDIILNARTGERMKVASVASTTTITAARSVGTTPGTAGVIGDGLYIVGNASEENATARNVNTTKSSKQSNLTQIFKKSISVSGTEKELNLYGGKDLTYLRAKIGTEHALDIERAFWFSEKNDGTGDNTLPERTTGGILEFIESSDSYIQDQGGVLTAPDFNTFLREAFTYGNSEKVLFAGGVVLQAINEFARGQLVTKATDKSYGVNISEYVTPFGSINIVNMSPIFVNDFAGHAFLLDLECFRYRFLNNRDTKLEMNVQANGTDGQVDQFLTECGLERKQAGRHALLKGVTA